MGQLYLNNVDFLKNGVPASIIATIVSRLVKPFSPVLRLVCLKVVATIGFLLMEAIGYVFS